MISSAFISSFIASKFVATSTPIGRTLQKTAKTTANNGGKEDGSVECEHCGVGLNLLSDLLKYYVLLEGVQERKKGTKYSSSLLLES